MEVGDGGHSHFTESGMYAYGMKIWIYNLPYSFLWFNTNRFFFKEPEYSSDILGFEKWFSHCIKT